MSGAPAPIIPHRLHPSPGFVAPACLCLPHAVKGCISELFLQRALTAHPARLRKGCRWGPFRIVTEIELRWLHHLWLNAAFFLESRLRTSPPCLLWIFRTHEEGVWTFSGMPKFAPLLSLRTLFPFCSGFRSMVTTDSLQTLQVVRFLSPRVVAPLLARLRRFIVRFTAVRRLLKAGGTC